MRCRFIEENNAYKNEQKVRQRNQRMPPGMASQDLMAYWGNIDPFSFPICRIMRPLTGTGYKFETLCLLQQPWDPTPREEIESREEQIVNNSSQYCSVVRTGIGSTRIVIGGEVDAGMVD